MHEYITITKLVAQLLIFSKEKRMFSMKWSCHPCFYYKKKQSLSEMKWKYFKPIIQCLQNSLESRFNTYFNVKSPESKETIIAALSHPFFKNK